MLSLFVHLQVALAQLSGGAALAPRSRIRRGHGDHGQTTAEYALVLLGAAAVAMLVVTWASKTDVIGKLFDFVVGHVIGSVK
jgi:hypothetical protein